MLAIKKARKIIAAEPNSQPAKILSDLVYSLESDQIPMQMTGNEPAEQPPAPDMGQPMPDMGQLPMPPAQNPQ